MNNNHFFPHYYNHRYDKDLVFLKKKYGSANAYYWYFGLLEILTENLENKIELSDIRIRQIIEDLNIEEEKFENFISDCCLLNLFILKDNILSSIYLEEKIEKMKYISKQRSKAATIRHSKNKMEIVKNEPEQRIQNKFVL